MDKETGKLELAVGAFILIGIAIIMFMILYMSGSATFAGNAYFVVVDIQNIGDLKPGAPVKRGGFQIGKVRGIEIANENIQIVAAIDNKYRLRADSQGTIATSGLVGDSFLELSLGTAKDYLPQIDDEAKAPHLAGVSQASMGELLGQVQQIGAQVQSLVKNINEVVGHKEFRDNIEQSVANVNAATHEAKELLGNLRKDLDKVDAAVANVVKITASAENTMGKVNFFVENTIGDPAKVEDINKTITHIQELTGTLSQQRDYIAATIKSVSESTANLSRITSGIDPNKGLLRLLTDEQAGQELLATIQNLQRTANSLATVGLTDMIADKLAADRVFELWKNENKSLDAAQTAASWKEWMANQKRINNVLMYGRAGAPAIGGATPYCPAPQETSSGR